MVDKMIKIKIDGVIIIIGFMIFALCVAMITGNV